MRHVRPVISVLFLGAMLLAGRTAAASCSGPTIEYVPLEVAPGAAVTVAASGFGDNCYDTGPPPAGEGALGLAALAWKGWRRRPDGSLRRRG